MSNPRDVSVNFLPHISERECVDGKRAVPACIEKLPDQTRHTWLGSLFSEAEEDPSTHPTVRPTFMERSRSEMKRENHQGVLTNKLAL